MNQRDHAYKVVDMDISVERLKIGFPPNGLPDGKNIAKRLLTHLENGTTDLADDVFIEDPQCFTSQAQYEKEKDWLMKDMLHPIGLSCDLPGPNSFFTTEIMNVPLLLTRDADGKAHAFINACLHRGAAVKKEPCGSALRLSCPYHGWTYALDGELVGMPGEQYFADAKVKRGDKLVTLPLVEAAGMLHVGLTPDTPKNFEAQKGLLDVMAPLGFENWKLFKRRTWWTGNYNWKLAVATFLETYHIQFLHKGTVTTYLNSGVVAADKWGHCSRMSIPTLSIGMLRDIPESEWNPADHLTIMYHHFPTTTITMQGYMISFVQMFPGDTPDTSRIQHSIYTPHEVIDEDETGFRTGFNNMLNMVLDTEDFAATETISKSSKARALKSIFFGRNEINLQTFHAGIREAMNK